MKTITPSRAAKWAYKHRSALGAVASRAYQRRGASRQRQFGMLAKDLAKAALGRDVRKGVKTSTLLHQGLAKAIKSKRTNRMVHGFAR